MNDRNPSGRVTVVRADGSVGCNLPGPFMNKTEANKVANALRSGRKQAGVRRASPRTSQPRRARVSPVRRNVRTAPVRRSRSRSPSPRRISTGRSLF